MTTRFLLVRHAQSDWNTEGRFQGHSDRPLTDLGRQQAAQVAERLRHEPIDAVFSSPQQRSLQTAFAIANLHELPVHRDDRLIERGWGKFEGLTRKEVIVRYPRWKRYLTGQATRWPNDQANGIEDSGAVEARVQSIKAELITWFSNGTVVVVSHGATLNIWLRLALGIHVDAPVHFRLFNCAISEVLASPTGLTVHCLNENAHLAAESPA